MNVVDTNTKRVPVRQRRIESLITHRSPLEFWDGFDKQNPDIYMVWRVAPAEEHSTDVNYGT